MTSRLALYALAILGACLWWEAAFADIDVTLIPVDKTKPKWEYKLTVKGAPPNEPIEVYGSFGGPPYDATPIIKGTTNKDGEWTPPPFSEFKDGLRKTVFKIVIGAGNGKKTYENIKRPGGTFKAKEDQQGGAPGNALLRPNGLPLGIGSSVCVANLDGSGEVSDSLELTNLSASQAYTFLSLRVYRNLGIEFFNPSAFDSGEAIATGTLSYDVYADTEPLLVDNQTEATEFLLVTENISNATQEVLDECVVPAECEQSEHPLEGIGPSTDEAARINLGSHSVAADSYDLVIGIAVPILDDNSLGESVYFAFAHDCQVAAADLQPADGGQTVETGGAQ
jgi:hypothetical protein